MHWYFKVLKNYAVFKGRARRKEYWIFLLINFLIGIALGIIFAIMGASEESLSLVTNVYMIAILLPSIGVAIRRMHDTGRSGYWLLLPVVNYVFLCFDSQPHDNEYGPNPKAGLNQSQSNSAKQSHT
ncbi:DUF805 domain-containing protein [Methylophilus flavus]|uniref:DUF805 domain-containing protein n=1 Tax=Methylophilus flavus TaxID=640084 RepID=A0ABW3P8F2_9PROT